MKNFAFNRNELAGSLGDLGLFVPIVAALVILNGVNISVILLSFGLLYIFSGLYFKIPIPVQPFKAVASIAIAMSLAPKIISASGLIMGLALAIIAITPISKYLAKIFSKPVIRGIQLAIGLFLIKAGYILLTGKQFFLNQRANLFFNNLYISLLIGIIVVALLVLFRKNRRIPAALVVISFGLIIGLSVSFLPTNLSFGPQPFSFAFPSAQDFYLALMLLVLPQLPMTLANSVIATNDVSKKYFGDKAKRVSPRSLLGSLSAANLTFGWFGAIPLCHGAGGMTAHYTFGSRTAGSNIIIGSLFVILGLAFGNYAIAILSLIPAPVYAVLLFYLGLQHALLITDLVQKKSYIISIGMGALALLTQNLILAIGIGYTLDLIFRAIPRLQSANNNLT